MKFNFLFFNLVLILLSNINLIYTLLLEMHRKVIHII